MFDWSSAVGISRKSSQNNFEASDKWARAWKMFQNCFEASDKYVRAWKMIQNSFEASDKYVRAWKMIQNSFEAYKRSKTYIIYDFLEGEGAKGGRE